MPVVEGGVEFERLTRRHAVKLVPGVNCSVEEASLAVGEVVGCGSVKSASRMNGAIVIFLDSTTKVNDVVETGVVIHDTFVPVLPLVSPAKKVIISNAPPFIKNETLISELSRYGQLVSPIKMVSLGCKSPQLKHVVCHRRQVFMVLKDNSTDLNLSFNFKVDGFNYMVFASSDTMKCFGCGVEGHLIRSCPARQGEQRPAAAVEGPAAPHREPGPAPAAVPAAAVPPAAAAPAPAAVPPVPGEGSAAPGPIESADSAGSDPDGGSDQQQGESKSEKLIVHSSETPADMNDNSDSAESSENDYYEDEEMSDDLLKVSQKRKHQEPVQSRAKSLKVQQG